jgi:hypothetical protein
MEDIQSTFRRNTIFCNNVIFKGCCKRVFCTFAHTLVEYNPKPCTKVCNINTCSFMHKDETKCDVIRRLGLSTLENKKRKIKVNKYKEGTVEVHSIIQV